MKRYIRSAAEPDSKEEILRDEIDALKDDFDFAISGIEKLAADGNIGNAMEQVEALSAMINGSVGEIAEDIAQSD